MNEKLDIIPRNYKGQAHGLWETYHHNGNLELKGTYIDGCKEGNWKSFWSNGNIRYNLMFKNNRIAGEYLEYHADGTIWVYGHFIKGVRVGYFFRDNRRSPNDNIKKQYYII